LFLKIWNANVVIVFLINKGLSFKNDIFWSLILKKLRIFVF